MLRVNQSEIDIKRFPVGELMFNDVEFDIENINIIEWYFENNEELVALMFIMDYIKEHSDTVNQKNHLFMPYIPYARQDRVNGSGDKNNMFTLKSFSRIINSMEFNEVSVIDPHSDVSVGLIDRVEDISRIRDHYIDLLFNELDIDMLMFPDVGCQKRLSHLSKPCVTAYKDRDFQTGEIKSFDLIGNPDIKGKKILIVDDICSKGGTFYYSAKVLKEHGAGEVYLYVTHTENSVLEGSFVKLDSDIKVPLMDTGYIKSMFTTDTIFTKGHENIYFANNNGLESTLKE